MPSKPAPPDTVPIPGTRRYHGRPCRNCGGTIRMLSNQLCFVCQGHRVKQAIKRQRKREPEKVREQALKRNYNLTLEQYDLLLLSQGRRCAICHKADPGKVGWHVDHCHRTGITRGILCSTCNYALGMFKDSVEIFQRAIDYLSGETQPARMFFTREFDWLMKNAGPDKDTDKCSDPEV